MRFKSLILSCFSLFVPEFSPRRGCAETLATYHGRDMSHCVMNHPACNKNEWVLAKSCLTVFDEIYECVTKQKFEIYFLIDFPELKNFFEFLRPFI